jgi:hypothetical protein
MLYYPHALNALLWSEVDEDGTPFDAIDAPVSSELHERLERDWSAFYEAAIALGFDAVKHRTGSIDYSQGDEWGYAAHDFILTRNGHGAGFWDTDRWSAPWGDKLTRLAEQFGELHCYLHDGEIHAE